MHAQVDCTSSRKYYHFIRLMGREASHLTLEVALATQPNLAFVGEEVKARGLTLAQVTNMICDLIVERSSHGLDYGVVLVPEGLIEFVPEVGTLMHELNDILATNDSHDSTNSYEGLTEDSIEEALSPASANVFNMLPEAIRSQLLLDRDPHGNVQVAKIESERLLGALVEAELSARASRPAVTRASSRCSTTTLGMRGAALRRRPLTPTTVTGWGLLPPP